MRVSREGCQLVTNQSYFLQQWCTSQIALQETVPDLHANQIALTVQCEIAVIGESNKRGHLLIHYFSILLAGTVLKPIKFHRAENSCALLEIPVKA